MYKIKNSVWNKIYQKNVKFLTNRQNCFKKVNDIDKCLYEGNEINKFLKK